MIIDTIHEIFAACPLITDGGINVNYLGEKPHRYSIDTVTCEPVIKKYTDGSTLRQYLFLFASREFYDMDTLNNMDTARFYEELSDWAEELDLRSVSFGSGISAVSLQVQSSGFAFDIEESSARFQIEFRLIYKKERY